MAEEMRVLSFQSLVTLPRGRELARLLANALMARQIAQNANVRTHRQGNARKCRAALIRPT